MCRTAIPRKLEVQIQATVLTWNRSWVSEVRRWMRRFGLPASLKGVRKQALPPSGFVESWICSGSKIFEEWKQRRAGGIERIGKNRNISSKTMEKMTSMRAKRRDRGKKCGEKFMSRMEPQGGTELRSRLKIRERGQWRGRGNRETSGDVRLRNTGLVIQNERLYSANFFLW